MLEADNNNLKISGGKVYPPKYSENAYKMKKLNQKYDMLKKVMKDSELH